EFDSNLGIAGHVAAMGTPMLVRDVSQDRYFFRGIDDKSSFQTRGLVAAPLIYRGEIIGVVEVLNKVAGEFDSQDLDLLQIFGNLAANAAHNAQQHDTVVRENRGLRETLKSIPGTVMGTAASMRKVAEMVGRVAASHATVLLLGETGTGKEVTARQIHALSP